MMKWQPAVDTVHNSDGTYNYVDLFDKIRQLDDAAADEKDKTVANVKPQQLIQRTTSFIDEVLIANCCFTYVVFKRDLGGYKWPKIAHFRPVSRYVSETTEARHIVITND